ncbi:MAG: NAD-dependent epimerase/dehydratase family protein [Chitinophagales bacterium]
MISINKNKTVAVAGAEGFVGNNICRQLLAQGYKVRAMYLNDPIGLKSLDVELFQGNICQPESLNKFTAHADIVINSAAQVLFYESYENLKAVNVDAVKLLVDSCVQNQVKRLIHIGSIQVYDQHPLDQVLDETRAYVGPDGDGYNRSKAEGDKEVLKGLERGLEVVNIAAGGCIGPNNFEPNNGGKTLLGYAEGPKPFPEKGGYNWVDVRDVAYGVVQAIEKGVSGSTYIMAGEWISMVDYAILIEKVLDRKVLKSKIPLWLIKAMVPISSLKSKLNKKPPMVYMAAVNALLINEQISSAKAEKELGFKARPLENSLKDTYRWFKGMKMME